MDQYHLSDRYDITPDETDALGEEAEQLEAAAPDTVRFTRVIKDAVDRLGVIEALWRRAERAGTA